MSGARGELVLPPAADAQVVPAGADLGVPGPAPFVTPNADFYRIDTALLVPQVSPDRLAAARCTAWSTASSS